MQAAYTQDTSLNNNKKPNSNSIFLKSFFFLLLCITYYITSHVPSNLRHVGIHLSEAAQQHGHGHGHGGGHGHSHGGEPCNGDHDAPPPAPAAAATNDSMAALMAAFASSPLGQQAQQQQQMQQMAQPLIAPLSEVVTNDDVAPLLSSPEIIAALLPLLPEGQQTEEELRATIRTPQFRSTLRTLTSALLSDNVNSIFANFGLNAADGGDAMAQGNPILAFLQALQAQSERENGGSQ